MRNISSCPSARTLAALALIVALVFAGTPRAILAAGSVSMSGKVYESAAGKIVSSGVVYAVNLTTKQVYQSAPIAAGGTYSLDSLPFGNYDVVIAQGSRVYLANRALNIPAGETLAISFVLEEVDPNDREWWSSAPDREVAGLERTPDGVARIVEDDSALARMLEKGGEAAPASPAPPPAAAPAASSTSRDWVVPLVLAGILGGALLLTDDNDDAEREEKRDDPVSPID